MKNIALTIGILLTLSGCVCNKEPVKPELKIVKQVEYVVKVPPKELLVMPPAVEKVNLDSATQADAAKFLLNQAQRMTQLENMIIQIGKFFSDEQAKLDSKASKENVEALKQ